MTMAESNRPDPAVRELTPEQTRGRRARNIAIAVSIAVFMALIYAVTIAKLGSAVLQRPL